MKDGQKFGFKNFTGEDMPIVSTHGVRAVIPCEGDASLSIPPPEEGTIYAVALEVCKQHPDRFDFAFPVDPVLVDGTIYGYTRLSGRDEHYEQTAN